MTRCRVFIFLFTFSIGAFTQDFSLRFRPNSAQYQVVSEDDIKALTAHGVALDGIKERLGAIDQNLEKIHTTLDKDVLPTIHVMDFFKWLFSLIIAAIIGAAVNNWLRQRCHASNYAR